MVFRCGSDWTSDKPGVAARTATPKSDLLALVHFCGIEHRIIFGANPIIQVKLSFKEINVAFFVFEQPFEQRHRNIIAGLAAVITRLGIKRPSVDFSRQIALQRFTRVLPNAQRVQFLQIG